MDESNPTCNKRFPKQGIPQTEEARRAYRELIITTPRLGECISGAILYNETQLNEHSRHTVSLAAEMAAAVDATLMLVQVTSGVEFYGPADTTSTRSGGRPSSPLPPKRSPHFNRRSAPTPRLSSTAVTSRSC